MEKGRLVRAPARSEQGSPNSSDATGEIDRKIGARIRQRRLMLGLSQQQLAQAIGVTYQQAHKYERGLNRIAVTRLLDIARALSAPVSWFFEDIETSGPETHLTERQRMCLELARNFVAIQDDRHRQALSSMARALVEQQGDTPATADDP